MIYRISSVNSNVLTHNRTSWKLYKDKVSDQTILNNVDASIDNLKAVNFDNVLEPGVDYYIEAIKYYDGTTKTDKVGPVLVDKSLTEVIINDTRTSHAPKPTINTVKTTTELTINVLSNYEESINIVEGRVVIYDDEDKVIVDDIIKPDSDNAIKKTYLLSLFNNYNFIKVIASLTYFGSVTVTAKKKISLKNTGLTITNIKNIPVNTDYDLECKGTITTNHSIEIFESDGYSVKVLRPVNNKFTILANTLKQAESYRFKVSLKTNDNVYTDVFNGYSVDPNVPYDVKDVENFQDTKATIINEASVVTNTYISDGLPNGEILLIENGILKVYTMSTTGKIFKQDIKYKTLFTGVVSISYLGSNILAIETLANGIVTISLFQIDLKSYVINLFNTLTYNNTEVNNSCITTGSSIYRLTKTGTSTSIVKLNISGGSLSMLANLSTCNFTNYKTTDRIGLARLNMFSLLVVNFTTNEYTIYNITTNKFTLSTPKEFYLTFNPLRTYGISHTSNGVVLVYTKDDGVYKSYRFSNETKDIKEFVSTASIIGNRVYVNMKRNTRYVVSTTSVCMLS